MIAARHASNIGASISAASLGSDMRASDHIPQIKALVASPRIRQYLVGITSNSVSRRRSYRSHGFPFYYVLETGLTKADALAMERDLFKCLTTEPVTRKKYHAEKRDSAYRASTGGKNGDNYVVYIAAYGD